MNEEASEVIETLQAWAVLEAMNSYPLRVTLTCPPARQQIENGPGRRYLAVLEYIKRTPGPDKPEFSYVAIAKTEGTELRHAVNKLYDLAENDPRIEERITALREAEYKAELGDYKAIVKAMEIERDEEQSATG